MKISFNTNFDPATGDVIFTTECPYREYVMVGSDVCYQCKSFRSITMKQQVECGITVEDENLNSQNSPYLKSKSRKGIRGVYVEAGGFSAPSPCNLSSAERKPVQTKIQTK